LIREIAADGFAEGLDHFKDSGATAGAEVPGAHTGVVGAQVVEGFEVALGEVEDVDIIADGGAVVGGVVVAEDEEFLALARGDLRQQWEEVVGDSRRVFAHDSARVRPCGVEVSKQTGVPLLNAFSVAVLLCLRTLGRDVVGDHELGGEFGVSVWVCRAQRALFRDGDHAGDTGCVAVDGGRGGVDDVGDVVASGGAQEGESAIDIDAVVIQGDFPGFSHGLEGSEVDDTVNVGVFLEDIVQGFFIGDVEVVVMRPFPADEFNAVEDFGRRVVQVVDYDDRVVGFEEGEGGEGANIARATREEFSKKDKTKRWRRVSTQ
jgi:hypothetical protein